MFWLNFFLKSKEKKIENTEPSTPLSVDTESVYLHFDANTLSLIGKKSGEVFDYDNFWRESVDLNTYKKQTDSLPVILELGLNDLKHRLEGISDISVSLPLDSVFAQYITIPKSEFAEQVLQSEMKKVIPIPFDEVVFAYNKVRETDVSEGYFCVVIHKNVFDKYTKVFKNYGMTPYFELSLFSLARLVNSSGVQVISCFDEGEAYVVMIKDQVVIDFRKLNYNLSNVIQELSNKININYADAKLLYNSIDNLKKDSNIESHKYLQEILEIIYKNISHDMYETITDFQTKHTIIVPTIIVSGLLQVEILKNIFISDTNLQIEFQKLNFPIEIDHLFIHCFGIAKRS